MSLDQSGNGTLDQGSSGGHIIEDEGTPLAQQDTINFTGVGVTATDSGGKTVVDVPGGSAGSVGTQQFPVNANAISPGISLPANSINQREIGANDEQRRYIGFPDGSDTTAYFDWFPPENWDQGTIKVKLYWTTQLPSAAAETIEVLVSGVCRGDDEAIGGAAFGTAIAINDTFLAVDDEHVTAQSASITLGGTPADFKQVQIKLLRDVSADTLAGELQLLSAIVEYTIDAEISVG